MGTLLGSARRAAKNPRLEDSVQPPLGRLLRWSDASG